MKQRNYFGNVKANNIYPNLKKEKSHNCTSKTVGLQLDVEESKKLIVALLDAIVRNRGEVIDITGFKGTGQITVTSKAEVSNN